MDPTRIPSPPADSLVPQIPETNKVQCKTKSASTSKLTDAIWILYCLGSIIGLIRMISYK